MLIKDLFLQSIGVILILGFVYIVTYTPDYVPFKEYNLGHQSD